MISISQTSEIGKFQNDLINEQLMSYEGETRISTSIDSAWMEYNLERFFDTKENALKFRSSSNNDSIILTNSERDLIILFFRNGENLKLTDNSTEFTIVEENQAISHLKSNYGNQVVYISKPLFIRNESLAIAFFANLCCGQIYGYVNFSFYRKENEIWKRWIDISSGAF